MRAKIPGFFELRNPMYREHLVPASMRDQAHPRQSDNALAGVSGAIAAITNEHTLTETQHARLRRAYEGIGAFLSEHPRLGGVTVEVHPQGSLLTGTTVRPRRGLEMDVDLVLLLKPGTDARFSCRQLLDETHQAMREYAQRYGLGIERKRRCVQMKYVDEMHADVTPVVHTPRLVEFHGSTFGLVPDRELLRYMGTNPKGYGHWFNDAATTRPRFLGKRMVVMDSMAKAGVLPLPSMEIFERFLPRMIQLLKIHRNDHFARDVDLAPPSVVISTTATHAYIDAVQEEFETPLDLVFRIWRDMPRYIERQVVPGGERWVLSNPTAREDNLADRMNSTPARQHAFDDWHHAFGVALSSLVEAADRERGLDVLCKSVETTFGAMARDSVVAAIKTQTERSRRQGRIVVPTGVASFTAMKSQPHRFFGGIR